MRSELVLYDTAHRALDEALRVDEVKAIRDRAVAWQAYAKQARDTTMITNATKIRMRAERRAGELLIEMANQKERHSGRGDQKTGSQAATPKLADLGINKTQSSRWQKLAALDRAVFETKIADASKRAYDTMTGRFLKEDKIKRMRERHAKVIEHGCTVDDLRSLIDSGRRFAVIYVDPPWKFEAWGESGKIHSAPEHYYGTEGVDTIMQLPVAQLAAADCALLLWCTGPHIARGTHTKVIEAWGFRPSTKAFCWVKPTQDESGSTKPGQGYYTRANSEDVFIGIKGSPLRLANDVNQVVHAPIGEHSAKPEEVRQCIERLFPGPYLELYGRQETPRWTVWGDEIAGEQFLPKRSRERVRLDDDE
jgi:N6-adenosine-specific RNA methylase IME4